MIEFAVYRSGGLNKPEGVIALARDLGDIATLIRGELLPATGD